MNDLLPTIAPKSDQLNADDLIGGPLTITVTKVLLTGSVEQPLSIAFEGDNGKPYKPCKSMRRVLVAAWGPDGNAYAGRSMTLYLDRSVTFGGDQVGGIRISHLSHIDRPQVIPLTVSRGKRKPYEVKPLATKSATTAHVDSAALESVARDVASMGTEALQRHWQGLSKPERQALLPVWEAIKGIAAQADAKVDADDISFDGPAAADPMIDTAGNPVNPLI